MPTAGDGGPAAGRAAAGSAYRFAALLLYRPLRSTTVRDYRGEEHLPRQGGVVLASNHLSWFDPLAVALMCWEVGRPARFLAKDGVFKIPGLGPFLRSAGQIPVVRDSAEAVVSFHAAVSAVRAGEVVVVFPESTITRDPDLWPMQAKTGAVRIAAAAGAPLLPVTIWGSQRIMPYGTRVPRLPSRETLSVWLGGPVDVSDVDPENPTMRALHTATTRLMDTIADTLAVIRDEPRPAGRYNPRTGTRLGGGSETSRS